MKKERILLFMPLLFILACSSGRPPESLFVENIEKMILIDRAMNFQEEVTGIHIIGITEYEDQVEVQVRVEGWATHADLAIGATLPASTSGRPGWAEWKFFCRKADGNWVIVEKYKVEEGFEEN